MAKQYTGTVKLITGYDYSILLNNNQAITAKPFKGFLKPKIGQEVKVELRKKDYYITEIINKTQSFDVKVETLVPTITTYRVSAQTPEEALNKIKTAYPKDIQRQTQKQITKKATVYNAGTFTIKLNKNY